MCRRLSGSPASASRSRPFNNDNTVVRAGAGVFADNLPGGLAENAGFNASRLSAFFAARTKLAPGSPGNPFAAAAASNAALQAASNPAAPLTASRLVCSRLFSAQLLRLPVDVQRSPLLQVEPRGRTAAALEAAAYGQLRRNARRLISQSATSGSTRTAPRVRAASVPTGFAGLPTAAANPALGIVQQYLNAGVASYNGLITSLQRRISDGLTFTVNYTFSHALDDVSNGGIANEPYGIVAINASITPSPESV